LSLLLRSKHLQRSLNAFDVLIKSRVIYTFTYVLSVDCVGIEASACARKLRLRPRFQPTVAMLCSAIVIMYRLSVTTVYCDKTDEAFFHENYDTASTFCVILFFCIRCAPSLDTFKKRLKSYLFSCDVRLCLTGFTLWRVHIWGKWPIRKTVNV